MRCTEPAYAKLNLTLDILGKRPDGYHDMRMVMQSVTLADEVSVELLPEPGLDITADLPFLPKGRGISPERPPPPSFGRPDCLKGGSLSTSESTSRCAPVWLGGAVTARRYCGCSAGPSRRR